MLFCLSTPYNCCAVTRLRSFPSGGRPSRRWTATKRLPQAQSSSGLRPRRPRPPQPLQLPLQVLARWAFLFFALRTLVARGLFKSAPSPLVSPSLAPLMRGAEALAETSFNPVPVFTRPGSRNRVMGAAPAPRVGVEDAPSGPDVGAEVHVDADEMDGLSSQMRGTSIQEGEIQSTQLPSRPRRVGYGRTRPLMLPAVQTSIFKPSRPQRPQRSA